MSEVFPKFIIEDGNLILSKVSFHKEMVTNKDNVRGGGWFIYRSERNSFVFHGDSTDFGKAKLEDVKKCVLEKKVFTNPSCTHDISDRHDFFYDTGTEFINLKE